MKILFAYPFFLKDSVLEQNWKTPYFPLGILYLAGAARQAGHSVSIFDGTFADGFEDFVSMFNTIQPDVVCITSLITLRERALAFGRYAIAQGAKVIYGGPDVQVVPSNYAQMGAILVVGEGEPTLIDLLNAFQNNTTIESIHGIAYWTDNVLKYTAPRQQILLDWSQLPLPARDLLNFEPYFQLWQTHHGYTSMTLAATRAYTSVSDKVDDVIRTQFDTYVRVRPIQDIVAEMKLIEKDYSVDRFRLVDDLGALGKDWLVALGEAMLMADIKTPYEGLKPLHFDDLPMYAPQKDLCAERTIWLPGIDHDPKAMDIETIQRRWEQGILQEGETLPSSCKNCS